MIFKKDNFWLGIVLGTIAPILGLLLFKWYKFSSFTFSDTLGAILKPPYNILSVALSLSLLLNALIFTIYLNTGKDYTAKGIFVTTVVYGIIVLSIKTFA